MKNFLLKNTILFLGIFMVIAYIVFIPMIGDWLKTADVDSFWICICTVIFFAIVGVLFHFKQKEEDRKWLSGEHDKDDELPDVIKYRNGSRYSKNFYQEFDD